MNFYANILENKGPVIGDDYFYQTKEEIENWLKKMKIKNYVINKNLTVDVNDFVNLQDKKLTKIPIKFNIVKGNFDCYSNKLTSLKGSPNEVTGAFYCSNNHIESLEYCPQKIGVSLMCQSNNLKSLKGCPKILKNFDCSNNKLQSLKYCAETIEDSFSCASNQLVSLEYFPFVGEYVNIERSGFDISESGLKGLRNMSSVLLFELLNKYPYLEWEKLEWKEIDWSRVKIDETVVALYEMIENNKNRKQCEFILEKFEELQLY